jgi:hypothetical protein
MSAVQRKVVIPALSFKGDTDFVPSYAGHIHRCVRARLKTKVPVANPTPIARNRRMRCCDVDTGAQTAGSSEGKKAKALSERYDGGGMEPDQTVNADSSDHGTAPQR